MRRYLILIWIMCRVAVIAACTVGAATAKAQQITGTLGSPSAGKHTIVFDFKYDGPGPGKGGTGVLSVDGKEVAKKSLEHTIPLMMAIDETFDIGVDTRSPVDFGYEVPFRFTGTIDKLTYKLGPTQLSSEEHNVMERALARAKD